MTTIQNGMQEERRSILSLGSRIKNTAENVFGLVLLKIEFNLDFQENFSLHYAFLIIRALNGHIQS